MFPNKWWRGFRSDGLAGQGIGPPFQIQRSGNTALRWLRISTLKWGGARLCSIRTLWRTAKGSLRLTSMCISTTISMLYFVVAGLEGEALFHGQLGHLTWIPFIISMGLSKFTCVWDPSRNGHGINYQNCSCLWYSKHIRDICQGATESCTLMSFLHWGWWPSIWATVVRCKMVR